MIELVENDKVGVIIAKDAAVLSKLSGSRSHTEMLFPEHDVCFIAVNSGVDSTNQQDNDFTPFLNIINEFCQVSSKGQSGYEAEGRIR